MATAARLRESTHRYPSSASGPIASMSASVRSPSSSRHHWQDDVDHLDGVLVEHLRVDDVLDGGRASRHQCRRPIPTPGRPALCSGPTSAHRNHRRRPRATSSIRTAVKRTLDDSCCYPTVSSARAQAETNSEVGLAQCGELITRGVHLAAVLFIDEMLRDATAARWPRAR